MTLSILSLSASPVMASFLSSVAIYVFYLAATRYLLHTYRSKDRSKPYHYRMFRLYNEKIISNSPSRSEKHFYMAANKVTWVFNALLLLSVASMVVACFMF